jgi:uncharacterized protein (UPF0276 family)
MRQLLTHRSLPELTGLGPGLGWRPALASFVEDAAARGDVGFVEVLAEHVNPRALPEPLVALRDNGLPIVVHGLGLSLGGAGRPNRRRLRHLAACAEVVARTGVGLLVDVANLHANARNHGTDPVAVLDRLPLDHLAYVHVAGGVERGGFYRDTHRHPVPAAVLDLLGELRARTDLPGVLVEWDGCFPPEAELEAELAAVSGP